MRAVPFGMAMLAAVSVLPARGDGVSVEQLLQATTSWDGETLPPYSSGQPEITILKITIAPGEQLEKHLHTAINAGVLLSGQLAVKTESGEENVLQTHHASPGRAGVSQVSPCLAPGASPVSPRAG